jgi:23S rRNA (guanosine2251-2'-O)-methyltransferase
MQWLYGRHTVREVLSSNFPALKLMIADNTDQKAIKDILDLARQKHIPIQTLPKKNFNALIRGNHQGVAVQVETVAPADFKSFLITLTDQPKAFICLLDEIQDPQNLGAIIRSAVCFGCNGIVLPKWRSASLTESVMKASSGAAAHIPMIEIANLTVAVERLKEKGFFIYGADVAGTESLNSMEFCFPLALILGNEHRGIKPVLKNQCDKLITIPQSKQVASLNVASAASVFFYEISKQNFGT